MRTCLRRRAKDAACPQRINVAASQLGIRTEYVDIVIQFVGASEIPRTDLVGSADSYFAANLHDKLSYILRQTRPRSHFQQLYRQIPNLRVVRTKRGGDASADECAIEARLAQGTTHACTQIEGPKLFSCLFDWLVHYSGHNSLTVEDLYQW
ncbi:hypothetical protein EV401DRAFT_1480332 [Pisolithus croceorrhizus]|nr:hypothetical protein EV401DRAFT_1480332 [Pisolithus croceorrhizus]